ncbi:hypothetical protein [Clostridium sporogenes]|uniref:Uncharacterized protein n=1 Tax=Clostridium sporogenes TaxID=1509 RepID=A0ABX4K803_CLOSG|nr:hypothetical protein [Clostridium sporogenes]NFF65656.1 hypothetical protein [Clostridium sporogenes]PHH01644.1 hypothetical protein CRX47_18135 [Clostridium sporogenes]UBI12696.1 hypothetical protein LA336_03645 [Clostridium sporogenes]
MNYKCMSKKVASLVIIGTILSSSAVYAADTIKKDESVYVTLNQNGVIKEKIVSDWLHSENAGISIKDKSELTGIKNIKGNEKPEISGDKVTWKSDKKDIFYQGKTDKKLPIETDIVYKLDGKEIKPQELAGKSGKVTINIKIKNTDAHKVTVNGKERTIYTPFAVAAVVNLPIDKFTNVDVSEGEIISDGNNQAITFVTVPGLKESLNVDENILDIDLKDEIEITADAKDFELAPIMMTATTKIPEMDKIEKSDKIDELQNGINDIKDATSKLEDGSSKLADGASELAKGLDTLSLGSNKLAENMNKFDGVIAQLSGGAGSLTGGIKQYTSAVNAAKNGTSKLNAGMAQVSKGANDLGKGAVGYSTGAKQFAKSSNEYADGATKLAETVKSKSGELANGANSLQDGSTKLEAGARDISNNVAKINGGLENLVKNTETIKAGSQNLVGAMDQGINTASQLKGAKQSEIEGINSALANMEGLREVANSIENSEQKSAMLAKINTEIETLQGMKNSSSQIIGGLSKLEGGLGEAKTGAENLNGGIAKVQQGQNELYEGSQKLYNGTNDLSNGMSNLTKGVKDLNSGVSNLNPTLGAAVGKLNEGSKGLKAGANGLGKASSDLMSGSNKFVKGSKQAVAGMNGLYSGLSVLDSKSSTLVNGSSKISNGLSAAKEASSLLSSGAGNVSSGTNKLTAGANKVSNGNKELSVNMTKFNNEGVKKIDDKLGTKITDVKEILDVKDEIVNLSKNYGTFTGLGDDMEGNVKFIMRTDEIKKPKEEESKKEEKASAQDKTSAQKEEKGGIGNWIKNLFS